MGREKYDGIIFDMDGTIWDTTMEVAKIWSRVVEGEPGIERRSITQQEIQSVMGMQIQEIGKVFFPELDEERRNKLLKECSVEENKYLSINGGTLYDGVEDTIRELSTVKKLFIVSNCSDGYIEAFLEGNKMEKYFTDYEHPGRTGMSKGENIKLLIERNKLESPVYVGDTEIDRKAAEYAGIPFIYASYGFGEVNDYTYKIETFDKLKEICI